MINVDSFACFCELFLEKKRAMQLPTQKKGRYLLHNSKSEFKNCLQELDFLEIRYYVNLVIITHCFKIKQHQNAFCLRFLCASKHFIELLKKLISTPERPTVDQYWWPRCTGTSSSSQFFRFGYTLLITTSW